MGASAQVPLHLCSGGTCQRTQVCTGLGLGLGPQLGAPPPLPITATHHVDSSMAGGGAFMRLLPNTPALPGVTHYIQLEVQKQSTLERLGIY